MKNNGFKDLIKAGSILIAIAGFVVLYESLKQLETSNKNELLNLLKKIDKKLK